MDTQQPTTYANAAKSLLFPTKEQAILIDALEGIQLKEYITALAKIVPPAQIRFVSRISNNRICVYLSSKTLANDLVDKSFITINDKTLTLRPLISKNKRIILSNVPPIIPHCDILKILNQLNIQTTSEITFLRAGLNDPSLSHIMSFRRQVYINPEDVNKLPDSFKMIHDNTTYWIYLSTDSLTCFLCKNEGHVAKNCPTVNNENNLNIPLPVPTPQPLLLPSPSQIDKTILHKISSENSTIPPENPPNLIPPVEITPTKIENTINNKRQHSESSSNPPHLPESQDDSNESSSNCNHVVHHSTTYTRKKKVKKVLPISDLGTNPAHPLAKIETEMSNHPSNYPLNFLQLSNLLERTHGSHNPLTVAKEFSNDIPTLIDMLNKLYSLTADKGQKIDSPDS
ncbi:hypothetical protein KPH14_012289 [Odynerus spinipes]|uniref:CCHC-type domain-containing protein n=1 Tax=Odynerus spinipes TaxID=1348599 RepID=A0AAD9REI0_9HYME|nr:hypothetical protein KPH14_012289 [Odynerus spinipes]